MPAMTCSAKRGAIKEPAMRHQWVRNEKKALWRYASLRAGQRREELFFQGPLSAGFAALARFAAKGKALKLCPDTCVMLIRFQRQFTEER
jgi:hypothetical protein